MELLVGTSLIAAFIAGLAALFAPCCIGVLLPSYLGSVFRQKSKVFLMTFLFFLGVLAVFLPLGLGIAAIGQALSRYHNIIFAVGAVFMISLGLSLLLGKRFSLPFHVNPVLKDKSPASVFVLGIFSGLATTCCAPVLAGVLALAALPGSIFWGGIYTLSYVLGMVTPLFIIAAFLDKINFTQKFLIIKKPLEYPLLGQKINITISEAVSGIIFSLMGLQILYLAFTNRLYVHSETQVDINILLTKVLNIINGFTSFIPEYVWAGIFAAILFLIIKKVFNQLNLKINLMTKNNIGTIIGAIGIVALVAAIFISQGNNAGNQNRNQSSSNPAGDDMASHHSENQPKNISDLNNLVSKPVVEFSLSDRDGKTYSSKNLRGKNIVMFFNEGLMCYPACWNQIAAFPEDERFKDAVVLSVVADSKETWQKAVDKMPALAQATVVFDTGAAFSRKLGMLTTGSSMHYGSLPGHSYILIDKEGIIQYAMDDPSMRINNDLLAQKLSQLNTVPGR